MRHFEGVCTHRQETSTKGTEQSRCSAENEEAVAEEQPQGQAGHKAQAGVPAGNPVIWILLIPAGQPAHNAEDRSSAFPTGLSLHSEVTSHAFLQGQEEAE